jgi:hypothetical protein
MVDAFTALSAGQIDAVLLDTPIVLGAVKANQIPEGEVVGQFETGEKHGAVINKDSKNLAAFNQVITTLKSEGFIDQLREVLRRPDDRAGHHLSGTARPWSSSSTPSSAGRTSRRASRRYSRVHHEPVAHVGGRGVRPWSGGWCSPCSAPAAAGRWRLSAG